MVQFKKWMDRIFSFNEAVCKLLLAAICVLMWLVVFGRYFFGYTPIWSEDMILLCMCWIVMLSGAEAFRRDAHIRISVFQDLLPDGVRGVLAVVIDILSCCFFAYMIKVGLEQVMANEAVFYTGLKISKLWAFLCFPVSFFLTILAKLEKYVNMRINEGEGAR